MMDITVGMFFISSGAGNGLGPPSHSGIETKSNIKNVLGAAEGRSYRAFSGRACCDTSGNDDLCEEGCLPASAVKKMLFCSKVRSIGGGLLLTRI